MNSQNNVKIMIVSPDSKFSEKIALALANTVYEITSALNESEAAHIAELATPALIIKDYHVAAFNEESEFIDRRVANNIPVVIFVKELNLLPNIYKKTKNVLVLDSSSSLVEIKKMISGALKTNL